MKNTMQKTLVLTIVFLMLSSPFAFTANPIKAKSVAISSSQPVTLSVVKKVVQVQAASTVQVHTAPKPVQPQLIKDSPIRVSVSPVDATLNTGLIRITSIHSPLATAPSSSPSAAAPVLSPSATAPLPSLSAAVNTFVLREINNISKPAGWTDVKIAKLLVDGNLAFISAVDPASETTDPSRSDYSVPAYSRVKTYSLDLTTRALTDLSWGNVDIFLYRHALIAAETDSYGDISLYQVYPTKKLRAKMPRFPRTEGGNRVTLGAEYNGKFYFNLFMGNESYHFRNTVFYYDGTGFHELCCPLLEDSDVYEMFADSTALYWFARKYTEHYPGDPTGLWKLTGWSATKINSGDWTRDQATKSGDYVYYKNENSSSGYNAIYKIKTDGTNRTPLFIGNADVNALAVYQNALFAGGKELTRYNLTSGTVSTAWKFNDPDFPTPNPAQVERTMVASGSNLYVGAGNTVYKGFYRNNQAPTANIVPTQTVRLGSTVSFTPTASDPDGTIIKYEWDFNDDGVFEYKSQTTGATTNTFTTLGTFTATFRVTDNDQATANDTAVITVVNNVPPVAEAGSDITTRVGRLVTFDASQSYDTDGSIATYSWDFTNDGYYDYFSTTPYANYTYPIVGTFTPKLKITDDDSASAIDVVIVYVLPASAVNQPPVLTTGFVTPQSGNASTQFAYHVQYSDMDEESPVIKNVYINTVPHTMLCSRDTLITWNCSYQTTLAVGSYEYSFEFSDGAAVARLPTSGAFSGPTVVTEANAAPLSFLSANQTTAHVGKEIMFDGSLSYDPDGTIVSYTFNFGDSNTYSGAGSPAVIPHAYSANGMYYAGLSVTDNDGATSQNMTAIQINITNIAPTATLTANATSGYAPLSVLFDASASSDSDGAIAYSTWDFGDGGGAGSVGPPGAITHNYSSPGAYTAVLTVTDNDAATGTANLNITILQLLNRIVNSTIDGAYYALLAVPDGIVGSTTLNGQSNITDSEITASTLSQSAISKGSLVKNSTIVESTIINSTVLDSDLYGMYVENAYIDPNNFTFTTITNSNVLDSDGTRSRIINNSNINASYIGFTNATNSTIWESFVNTSTITDSFVCYCKVLNSTIIKSSVCNMTIKDAFIQNGTVINGTVTYNFMPTAEAGLDQTTYAGTAIQLNGTGTDDINVSTYEWDFNGDGVYDYASTNSGITTYAYPAQGAYNATLRVTDNDGLQATDYATITVNPAQGGGNGNTGGGGGGTYFMGGGGARGPPTTITYSYSGLALGVYRDIEYNENGTKITFTVTNYDGKRSFAIKETIPKQFAQNTTCFQAISTPYPTVYEYDPVIGWNITLDSNQNFTAQYLFPMQISTEEFAKWPKPTIIELPLEETVIPPVENNTGNQTNETTPPVTTASFSLTGLIVGAFTSPYAGLALVIIIIGVAYWYTKGEAPRSKDRRQKKRGDFQAALGKRITQAVFGIKDDIKDEEEEEK